MWVNNNMLNRWFVALMLTGNGSGSTTLLDFPLKKDAYDIIEGAVLTLPHGSIYTENGVLVQGTNNTTWGASAELVNTLAISEMSDVNAKIMIECYITLSSWATTGWQGAIDCGFSSNATTRETTIASWANILGAYYAGSDKQIIDFATHKINSLYVGAETHFYIDDVFVETVNGAALSDNINNINYIGLNAGQGNFYYKNLKIIKLQ